jgi:hypothetical protein
MIGIVSIKVESENGPIRRGYLLVSLSTIGYAMKEQGIGRFDWQRTRNTSIRGWCY